jgi:hypothetical protein
MRVPKEKINRVFDVAAYFQAASVRIFAGTRTKEGADEPIRDWMQMITERCLASNLMPLYETTAESHLSQPAEVATLLSRYRRWRLLYDPVQLILKQNQDPFSRYWTLLKGFAAAMDVRDFKIGHGFKPAGFGDARIAQTLQDALQSGFQGWYFLEPSLGRRFGSAMTKRDTFKLALEALDVLVA